MSSKKGNYKPEIPSAGAVKPHTPKFVEDKCWNQSTVEIGKFKFISYIDIVLVMK